MSAGPQPTAQQGGDLRGLPTDLLDLSTCISRYGPSPAALESLRSVSPAEVQRHPYEAAGELIAGYASRLGVPPDELVVGRGTSGLVASLRASDLAGRLVIPTPAYTEYLTLGARLVGPREGRWGLDRRELRELVVSGACVLIANPQNPSGQVIDRHDLYEIVHEAPGRLIVDESYIDFISPSQLSMVGARADNVAVLRSPSKFSAIAGLRVGVAWTRDPVLRAALTPHTGTWPVSSVEVHAALAAIQDLEHEELVRSSTAADLRRLRELLQPRIAGCPAANFVLLDDPSAGSLHRALLGRGVNARLFGNDRGLPRPAIRIAAPTIHEWPRFAEAWLAASGTSTWV